MKNLLKSVAFIMVISISLISCRETTTEKEVIRTETETVRDPEPVVIEPVEETDDSNVEIELNEDGNVSGEVKID